jgi:hypothetical protein
MSEIIWGNYSIEVALSTRVSTSGKLMGQRPNHSIGMSRTECNEVTRVGVRGEVENATSVFTGGGPEVIDF